MPEARFPLAVAPAPLTEIPVPETLTFFLGRSDLRGPFVSPAAIAGVEVSPGQPLGTRGEIPLAPSPVAGTVQVVKQVPDVRGGKPGLAVILEPTGPAAASFEPLDPVSAPGDELVARLAEAGIDSGLPGRAESVVVLAADSEPGLSSTLRMFADDPIAATRATALMARLASDARPVLAVLERHESELRAAAGYERVSGWAERHPPELGGGS